VPTTKCEQCGTYWDNDTQRNCPTCRSSGAPTSGGTATSGPSPSELQSLVDQARYQSDTLMRIHFWVRALGLMTIIGVGAYILLALASL